MEDWANNDKNLLTWRAATGETAFEKTPAGDVKIAEQEFFLLSDQSARLLFALTYVVFR